VNFNYKVAVFFPIFLAGSLIFFSFQLAGQAKFWPGFGQY